MLYMDTLAPILKMIEDTMMAQLIDTEPAWDGYFVEYEMDAVLRGNFEQRSQAYLRYLQSGVRTPNELRNVCAHDSRRLRSQLRDRGLDSTEVRGSTCWPARPRSVPEPPAPAHSR